MKMPTLGPRPKSSLLRRLVVLVLLGSAGGAVYYGLRHRPPDPRPLPPPPTASEALAQAAIPAAQPAGPAPGVALPPVEAPPAKLAGPRFVVVVVDGPLETSLGQSAGREIAPALTQVVTRSLVWWMSVPGDLRKGDRLEVVFEERPSEEPLLHAVRFTSSKLAKTFRAYRFKADGEKYARYYQPDGSELELRLATSPLAEYEQITSLIKDGRRHKGVDFRTPVGTPVKATFAGVITRRNWNWRSNGNSLEVTESSSPFRKAMYLHLSELPKTIKVGQRVSRGETLGESGNSGHSFAPHLHYQLMAGNDRVLDPFDGETSRHRVPAGSKAALDAEIARLDALMGTAVAAGQ